MEAIMDRSVVEEITTRFQALVSIVPLSAIRTPKDYDKAVPMLNQSLDFPSSANKRSTIIVQSNWNSSAGVVIRTCNLSS